MRQQEINRLSLALSGSRLNRLDGETIVQRPFIFIDLKAINNHLHVQKINKLIQLSVNVLTTVSPFSRGFSSSNLPEG